MILLLIRLFLVALLIWFILGVIRKGYRLYATWRAFNPSPTVDETMKPCGYCGAYIPPDIALKVHDTYFCSPEHLAAAVVEKSQRDNTP